MEIFTLSLTTSCTLALTALGLSLVAGRFFLAVLGVAIGLHPFLLQAWYHIPLETETAYLQLVITMAAVGVVLLFRRWPVLWVIISVTLLQVLATYDLTLEEQFFMISVYLVIGILAPAIMAFTRTTTLETARAEVTGLTAVIGSYCCHTLAHQIYNQNQFIFRTVKLAVSWAAEISIKSYVLHALLYIACAAFLFMLAEILFYIAPEESDPTKYSLLYGAVCVLIMAFIQPTTPYQWLAVALIAAYLIFCGARRFSDRRSFWYACFLLAIASANTRQQTLMAHTRKYASLVAVWPTSTQNN